MPRLFDLYMLLAFRAWARSQPEIAEEYMTLAWQCVPDIPGLSFGPSKL